MNNRGGSTNGRELVVPESRRARMLERLLSHVTKTPTCWNWTGSTVSGYGHIGFIRPRVVTAHRLSYALFVAPAPAGMVVMHSCDNRVCVNPKHLRLGTQSENVRDAVSKGRQYIVSGELHHNAKLTDAQRAEVKRLYRPGVRGLAARFGIDRHTVRKIGLGL